MNDWTIDDVAARFAEAAETGRRLPRVRVQGYFNVWPEFVREAAENARANAALNGISDAEFICADADRCGGLIVGADIVVVDPPRKGLSPGLISDIAAAGPRAVADANLGLVAGFGMVTYDRCLCTGAVILGRPS